MCVRSEKRLNSVNCQVDIRALWDGHAMHAAVCVFISLSQAIVSVVNCKMRGRFMQLSHIDTDLALFSTPGRLHTSLAQSS